jgi:16S rRNA (cytosine967-C5)-methyltransferase
MDRTTRIEREAPVVQAPTPPQQMAARIVARSNPRQPADLLLRQALARRKGLTPEQSAWISRAVFAYFRWLNWVDATQTLEERIDGAMALSEQFNTTPDWPSNEEILQKAVPAWVLDEGLRDPVWARSLQRDPALWLRARPGSESKLIEALEPGALVAGPLP